MTNVNQTTRAQAVYVEGWCACAKNVCDDLSISQCPVRHFPRGVVDAVGLADATHELQVPSRRRHLSRGPCATLRTEARHHVRRLVEMRAERPAERNTRTREPCKENAKIVAPRATGRNTQTFQLLQTRISQQLNHPSDKANRP